MSKASPCTKTSSLLPTSPILWRKLNRTASSRVRLPSPNSVPKVSQTTLNWSPRASWRTPDPTAKPWAPGSRSHPPESTIVMVETRSRTIWWTSAPVPASPCPVSIPLAYREPQCLSPASSNSSTSWHSENLSPWASPCVSPSNSQAAGELCPRIQGIPHGFPSNQSGNFSKKQPGRGRLRQAKFSFAPARLPLHLPSMQTHLRHVQKPGAGGPFTQPVAPQWSRRASRTPLHLQ